MRGYFGIGIYCGKNPHNLGTLWRSANLLGAAFIFIIGKRYKHQASDTLKTPRHVPLYEYKDFETFYENMPKDCPLIGIELNDKSIPLNEYSHRERCCYILGAEDHGLSQKVIEKCVDIIQLKGRKSMNVAVAGSIVMHSR